MGPPIFVFCLAVVAGTGTVPGTGTEPGTGTYILYSRWWVKGEVRKCERHIYDIRWNFER